MGPEFSDWQVNASRKNHLCVKYIGILHLHFVCWTAPYCEYHQSQGLLGGLVEKRESRDWIVALRSGKYNQTSCPKLRSGQPAQKSAIRFWVSHDGTSEPGMARWTVPFVQPVSFAISAHDCPARRSARSSLNRPGPWAAQVACPSPWRSEVQLSLVPQSANRSNSATAPRMVKTIFPAGVPVSICSEREGEIPV